VIIMGCHTKYVVPCAGALCSLSSLTRLRELRLGDVDGNNPEDVDTVCNMVSQLTALHMGYCPRLQVRSESNVKLTSQLHLLGRHKSQGP
jgi:hypothetical protein